MAHNIYLMPPAAAKTQMMQFSAAIKTTRIGASSGESTMLIVYD